LQKSGPTNPSHTCPWPCPTCPTISSAWVRTRSVVEAFVRYGDRIHESLVWTGNCKSWYKKNRVDGRVTALFGGSSILYKALISDIRAEDFDIEYRGPNPFRFLGNGFTQYEMDDDNDLSWYIEK